VLLPMCDAVVDLHSGGKTLDYLPSALVRRRGLDDPLFAAKLAALKAFRAPIGYLVTEAREDRTIIAAADRAGILGLGTELGGAGTVTLQTLDVARRGVRNILSHLGLSAAAPDAGQGPATRVMEVAGPEYYLHAPCRGLFEPAFELGDEVAPGQTAGYVHFVDDPAREEVPVAFAGGGTVICKRPILQVERGDCLAHLATYFHG
jgi:predicted deacylase